MPRRFHGAWGTMRVSTVVSLSMGVVAVATAILVERVISPQLEKQASVKAGMVAERLMGAALNAASRISAERGPANGVLGSELPLPSERLEALAKARSTTDDALQATESALKGGAGFPWQAPVGDSLATTRGQLAQARKQIDSLARLPRNERKDGEIKAAVMAMIDTLPLMEPGLNAIENALVQADPALTNYVTIARLTTEMRDVAGQLGSVFTAAFVLKRPLVAEETGRVERLLGTIHAIDHQLRLAHQKTGSGPQLAAALAAIDREFIGGGLPLVRRVLETGRSSGDYGMTAAEFAKIYVPQMNVILELRSVALKDIAARVAETDARSRQSLVVGQVLALLVILSVVLTYLLIRWRMTRPLGQISQGLQKLAMGDYQIALPVVRWNDEISDVVAAVNRLADVVRSRELESRVAALVASISARLQSAENLQQLSQALFGQLAGPMHIGAASFYRYDAEAGVLVTVGGYARQGAPDCQEQIGLGENLVGECARQRQPILIDPPATDYLRVQSGLGEGAPRAVLILPVVNNDELLGVIEIATLTPIESSTRAAIDQLLPMLAMRMVIISRTERAQQLLAAAKA